MKRSPMKLFLVLAFASLLVFPAVVQSAPKASEPKASGEIAQLKATVVKVSGDVRIRSRGSLVWHDAKANEILSAGDQIETKEKGKIELRIENGNTINLKPKSKLVLKTLTRNLKTGDYENLLEVDRGKFRAKVEKIKGSSRFEVKSPTAVACVRGTIMYLIVFSDSTTAFFEEGIGFVTNPFSGQSFDVNPGNIYQIDENGNVTGPVIPTPEQLQDMIGGWDVGGGEGYSGGEGGDDLGGDTGSNYNFDDAMNDIRNSWDAYFGSGVNNTGGGTGTITETDTDGDGIPDSIDEDDDNDKYTDTDEIDNETDPLLAESTPPDNDEDFVSDLNDPDDDNDTHLDVADAFPFDPNEWLDTDGDLVGNNADEDDDGDKYTDADEIANGTDPLLASSTPPDNDLDYVSDLNDPDDDNDTHLDVADAFPFDPNEWLDTDGDLVGNNADEDDDGDGMTDTYEITYGLNPLVDDAAGDNDSDGLTNLREFNLGTYANDWDSDNDGLSDGREVKLWNTNPLAYNTDNDNDHVPDIEDAFPDDQDHNETRPRYYGSRDNIRNEIKDIIDRNDELIRDDIQDMIDDTNIRNLDARMEQVTDAQTGKVLTDRRGYRVRIEQYVLRPDSYMVQLLNINLRTQEAGSLSGLNTLDWTTRFNQSIDNLTGAQLRNLPWNEYLLGDPVKYGFSLPAHYPDWTQVRFDNSHGNTFMEKKDFVDTVSWSWSNLSWIQNIASDKVSFNRGDNWYDFSINSDSSSGFTINPSGLGDKYDVNVSFYVIADSGGLAGGMGSKDFDSIWELLAVNMPRASSEPWWQSPDEAAQRNIGNNNLEIQLTSKLGSGSSKEFDLIYIPWDRQTWHTSHHW